MTDGGRAAAVHRYEQLGAELRTMAETLLFPYWRSLIVMGFPERVAMNMVMDLQAQMIQPTELEADADA